MFERGSAHCPLADDGQVFLHVAVSNLGSEQMLLGLSKLRTNWMSCFMLQLGCQLPHI